MTQAVVTDLDEGIREEFWKALWHVDSAARVIGCCQPCQRHQDSLGIERRTDPVLDTLEPSIPERIRSG